MITPRFSCTQTETEVSVRIYVPAVRASDVEMHVDGTLFSVHISPYFLRLVFPATVIEDETSSAVYDPATGYLTVTLTKETPGQEFKDLDMLAKLLAPPKRAEPASQPTIEVLDSQDSEQISGDDLAEATERLSLDQREVLEAAENDWHLPQQIPDTSVFPSINVAAERRYGFLNAYTGYFNHVGFTENEVNELGSEVEQLSPKERRSKRVKHEDEKWDEDYYIADYLDDEYIQEIIRYSPPSSAPCSSQLPNPLVFTEEENMEMLRLPRKEYLATPQQNHGLYLTLLTILFSTTYDSRTTQNDPTPESAWTICSLTPAFTALDPPPYSPPASYPLSFTSKDVQEALIPSVRRSLAFPLYRSFALAEKCIQDVSIVLSHGRRAILRSLLELKKILDGHDVYYIYSKIWVDDFARWVASDASDNILHSLGQTLASTKIDKQSLGWDIQSLEDAARQEQETPRSPDSDDESDSGDPDPRPLSRNDDSNDIDNDSDSVSVTSSSSSTSTLSSSCSSSSSSELESVNMVL